MIIGIDPGISGAMAWVSSEGHLIRTADMPTITIRKKNRIDVAALADALSPVTRASVEVVIEGVASMPTDGRAGAFSFGYAAGVIEGVIVGLGLSYRIVQAAKWKRAAGVPADKGAVRLEAQRLWPGATDFRRVKDHNRADAALLARWAALERR